MATLFQPKIHYQISLTAMVEKPDGKKGKRQIIKTHV